MKTRTTEERTVRSAGRKSSQLKTLEPSMAKGSTDNLTAEQQLPDEQLLCKHREQPENGYLAVLIKRYERELYNYLRRYLGDATLAEDAFQAAFLQVHLKSDRFDAGRRFRPWLYTIATNQAIDLQRRNKRHQAVSLDKPNCSDNEQVGSLMDLLDSNDLGPNERFDRRERIDWVRKAVAALPEQLQSAVSLVYFRGMKYREAAVELSVPVGTVKSRLHSAIGRLGKAWQEWE